ncbi:MAG: glycosyltransferase family 2 protein [Methylococcaceae bacterium]|nr:glycosyltransferase family 2 protein [Methylococcaceae bacterium]
MAESWLVVPAYNEAATIRTVVERARPYVDHLVVVNDGSTDSTGDILAELPVTVLTHDSNRGKAASLWHGLTHAVSQGAERVLTLDGDDQHEPADIPALLEAAERHPDRRIVGSRFHDPSVIPKGRRRSNRVANFWIGWAAGQPIEDSQSGFRVYPAELIRRAKVPVGRDRSFVFESEIIIEAARLGFAYHPVPIRVRYRVGARPSHFKPVMDIVHITRMVACRLWGRGFDPIALWRSLRGRRPS